MGAIFASQFLHTQKNAPENMLLDLAFSVWVVYSQLRESFFKSRLHRIDISAKYSMISSIHKRAFNNYVHGIFFDRPSWTVLEPFRPFASEFLDLD